MSTWDAWEDSISSKCSLPIWSPVWMYPADETKNTLWPSCQGPWTFDFWSLHWESGECPQRKASQKMMWREGWIGRAQYAFRAVKLRCVPSWWLHVIIHLSKPTECTTPRLNTNVNSGLWMIMMCQCRSTSCNQCTTLAGNADNGVGCACVAAGGMWEISVSSARFCCELETALKIKVYF